jgi:L-ribulokinase
MSAQDVFVIGVDYGTDSVRSMIVNAINGQEIASSVFYYPRWKDALYCDASANQFRQHPLDYIEGLEDTIKRCLLQAGPNVAANVKGISVDTTGSTPIAVVLRTTPMPCLYCGKIIQRWVRRQR